MVSGPDEHSRLRCWGHPALSAGITSHLITMTTCRASRGGGERHLPPAPAKRGGSASLITNDEPPAEQTDLFRQTVSHVNSLRSISFRCWESDFSLIKAAVAAFTQQTNQQTSQPARGERRLFSSLSSKINDHTF